MPGTVILLWWDGVHVCVGEIKGIQQLCKLIITPIEYLILMSMQYNYIDSVIIKTNEIYFLLKKQLKTY